ncbi:hypothetical protein LNO19_26810 [Klebsiella quasipneumoniae subsp. similipneumoniae]|nr:hypothetical protein [Klebsiella quasipneumoniae subsp. similipneumoniae]
MSMQTVHRKALRQNPYSTLGKPPLRSSRDRITRAINGTWSLRELPDNVRELLIERAALRAEITTLTVKAQGLKKIRCIRTYCRQAATYRCNHLTAGK